MWSRFLSIAVALVLLAGPALASAEKKIAAMAPSGLVLVLEEDGKDLLARNAEKRFVPASVTKIVTAWLAMEVLGADHRFKTQFYVDRKRVLYVRGGGDPFLVSEELALIAPKLLQAAGKEPFTGMVLDGSHFTPSLRIPGIKNTTGAYNTLNTALAANFNTVFAVRRGKKVRSAEKQTPITPLAVSQFRRGWGRISLDQDDPSLSAGYVGELLAAFIEKAGGSVAGDISTGAVPRRLKPVYEHRQPRDLSAILTQMLLGSNNFIANQVFLEVGASGRLQAWKSR